MRVCTTGEGSGSDLGAGGSGNGACPLSLQQLVTPLMSSCGYMHTFCRKDDEKATSHRKGVLTKLQSPKGHADMRLTCGSPVLVGVGRHPKLFSVPG
jgi:hypothetical protein